MDFQKGDWVVSYGLGWSQELNKRVETQAVLARVWKRTKTQVQLDAYGTAYRQDGVEWRRGYRYLRAATPAEVAQGEAAEKEAQERVKALAEQADRFRDRLRTHDWASVSDTDVRWIARQLGWKDAE